jgi:hypothetical protein
MTSSIWYPLSWDSRPLTGESVPRLFAVKSLLRSESLLYIMRVQKTIWRSSSVQSDLKQQLENLSELHIELRHAMMAADAPHVVDRFEALIRETEAAIEEVKRKLFDG